MDWKYRYLVSNIKKVFKSCQWLRSLWENMKKESIEGNLEKTKSYGMCRGGFKGYRENPGFKRKAERDSCPGNQEIHSFDKYFFERFVWDVEINLWTQQIDLFAAGERQTKI